MPTSEQAWPTWELKFPALGTPLRDPDFQPLGDSGWVAGELEFYVASSRVDVTRDGEKLAGLSGLTFEVTTSPMAGTLLLKVVAREENLDSIKELFGIPEDYELQVGVLPARPGRLLEL